MALPLTLIMVGIIWVILTKVFFRSAAHLKVDQTIVDKEYKALGSMSFEERIVLMVFACTAFLWIFRKDLELGFVHIPGWSGLLPDPKAIDDGTVAIFMAMLLFFVPTRSQQARTEGATLLDASVFQKLPWGIILLFGGGFALAKGFQVTGPCRVPGQPTAVAGRISRPLLMIGMICASLTFLTEVTSNTATTQMILPILASLGVAMGENPLLLMIPATLSASCAFMMPVATPPNAIVFGSGRVKIGDMVKTGFFINIIGSDRYQSAVLFPGHRRIRYRSRRAAGLGQIDDLPVPVSTVHPGIGVTTMMKLLQRTLLSALTIALASEIAPAGAATEKTASPPENAVVIGAPLPLTGKLEDFGLMMQHSLDMAKEAINAAGGINGRPLHLVYSDDQGDVQRAQAVIYAADRTGRFGHVGGRLSKRRNLRPGAIRQPERRTLSRLHRRDGQDH